MRKWPIAIVIMLAITLLAGCGQDKYAAQAINEDVDVCAVCNMQVKDDAFATQIVTKDGKILKFDDLGCMNTWKQENGTDYIGMDYVRDYNDKEWIEFSKATYVYDASIRTPMAYGIVSFKDKSSAEAFVKEQGVGQILSAAELANHSWQQNQGMMHMHGEEDHEHGGDDGHAEDHEHDGVHGHNGDQEHSGDSGHEEARSDKQQGEVHNEEHAAEHAEAHDEGSHQ